MVESEIAGNFPNPSHHHFANVTKGSQVHHGQASHSTHHGTTHEDNDNQRSEKGDDIEHAN